MRNRIFLICAVAGMFVNLTPGLVASDRVALRVDPSVALMPATLRIRTAIEPDAGNRALEVVVDSEEFYSSSELRLDGERASRVRAFEFRDLPAGKYWITATLTTADGKHWVARQSIQVHSIMPE